MSWDALKAECLRYWQVNFERVMSNDRLQAKKLSHLIIQDLTEAIPLMRLLTLNLERPIKPTSPSSGGSNLNTEIADKMFMCHVANLIDEAELRLCLECADLYPYRQGHLFVCDSATSDFEKARHVPERSFDIKKFCEFLNTPPDAIV